MQVLTNLQEDRDHHLAGPFTPQTPLGSSTPIRTGSPVNKLPVSPWLRWAIQPKSAFKLLVIPVFFYFQWELLTPFLCNVVPDQMFACPKGSTLPNPFGGFFLLSHPVPTSNPADQRYAKGWNDLLFIAYNVVFWSCVRQLITVNIAQSLGRSWGIRKQTKLDRFGEQFYSVVYWGFMGLWGFRIMGQLPTYWYKTEYFWIDYPHWDMKPELKRYYLMQAAYWFQQLFVMVLGLEAPRKDYYELVAHHIVTIWLIGWSYLVNMTLIGNAVYMSMDIPDTFLALAKVFNYLQWETSKSIAFALLVVTWTYFRHILNFYMLESVWREFFLLPQETRHWSPSEGVYMADWMRYQIFAPLFLLQLLNLFWFYLILRILYRAIFGSKIDDDRSDDEDDEKKTQ